MTDIIFPTELHRQATEAVRDFFLRQQNVDTILLVNSLARGKATPDSDVDIAVLVTQPTQRVQLIELENAWLHFMNSDSILGKYQRSSKFAQMHLDIIDGTFIPAIWEMGGGVDSFEVEIGNRLAYSVPLTETGEHFRNLKLEWLPYYDAKLAAQRLELAKDSCLYDIEHIPFFVNRGLYFEAFDRLYVAFKKFLQALFIKNRTYPISYNKWIRDQVVEILKLPDLYQELPKVISVNDIESDEISSKAGVLHILLDRYC